MRIPKHRKHVTGQGTVRLQGIDYYTGKWGTEKAEKKYKQLIATYLASAGRPLKGNEQPTVGLVLGRYQKHAEQHFGEKSGQYARVKLAVLAALEEHLHTPAPEFKALALERVRDHMISLNWRCGFVNSCIGVIKSAFKWGARVELIDGNVYQNLRILAKLKNGQSGVKESRKIRPVCEDSVRKTLDELRPTVQAMVGVQLLAGMRPVEVCLMRWADCSHDGRDTDGTTYPGVWIYRPRSHKTQHHDFDRVIFLGPKAQALLLPFRHRPSEEFLFSPHEAVKSFLESQDRLFRPGRSRSPGKMYRTSSYGHAIKKACARAGVTPWSPNQLRHLCATRIRSKYTPDHARIVLGHKLPGVTGVYAEDDLMKAALVAREMG